MCSQVQTKNIFFYIVLMPDQFTIGSTVLVQEVSFSNAGYGCQRVVEEEVNWAPVIGMVKHRCHPNPCKAVLIRI
jgi:hypothetical protein